MSHVSTISISVSTKQLMSELGCECDRSRSRTGRCYLLSCYLEWSRCVQIMSIQQQDTIQPSTIHQQPDKQVLIYLPQLQIWPGCKKSVKMSSPLIWGQHLQNKIDITHYIQHTYSYVIFYLWVYKTLTLHYITFGHISRVLISSVERVV